MESRPFGWNAIDGCLQENSVEQETLTRMRELRGEGLGYLKVANVLNAEGRATKRGGPWQAMVSGRHSCRRRRWPSLDCRCPVLRLSLGMHRWPLRVDHLWHPIIIEDDYGWGSGLQPQCQRS